jgi:hypothetical protein
MALFQRGLLWLQLVLLLGAAFLVAKLFVLFWRLGIWQGAFGL